MTAWEHGRLTTQQAGAADGYRPSHSFAPVGGKIRLSDPGDTWEHTLQKLGLEGWEIAAIDKDVDERGRPYRVLYLKRPLP
ncbi:MAG: hypothetical protein ABWZ87_07550 [Aeromicrobium sp.]